MKITEELKETLKESYGMVVTSESPLTITPTDEEDKERYVGLPAELYVKDIIEEEESELDVSKVEELDDNQHLLVKASLDYADEFNTEDFVVTTAGAFKVLVEKLVNHDNEIGWYFGTNEEMCFSSGNSLLSSFTIQTITKEEADTLNKLFGGGFGTSNVFSRIDEILDGDLDEDEDEDGEEFDYDTYHENEVKRYVTFFEERGWDVKRDEEEDDFLTVSKGDDSISIYLYGLEMLKDHIEANEANG